MKVLDLCSGLGGFSEAFVRAGDSVTRIDNDPKFASVEYTETADVIEMAWDFGTDEPQYFDLVLAAPPCSQFSKVTRMYRGKPKNPDLSLVHACFQIAQSAHAPIILENACHLQDYIGKAACHRGGRYFWGDVSLLPIGLWNKFGGSWNPTRPSYSRRNHADTGTSEGRARIPFAISQAIRDSFLGGFP